MTLAFPKLLKQWRSTRRMSQLDLGLSANVSARHVSFLETGRSTPSRSMVLQLCKTLEVPLSSQNSLLHAAGFAEIYPERSLSDDELALAREAVDWTLQRHDPYPAMALDKYWVIVKANRAATKLLSGVGLQAGDSLLEAMQHSERLAATISNWQDVIRHMISRLRSESARLGYDVTLSSAADALAMQLKGNDGAEVMGGNVVLSTHYKLGGITLSLFSMLAQFSSAEDIALADLRVELMYPDDEATKHTLITMQANS